MAHMLTIIAAGQVTGEKSSRLTRKKEKKEKRKINQNLPFFSFDLTRSRSCRPTGRRTARGA